MPRICSVRGWATAGWGCLGLNGSIVAERDTREAAVWVVVMFLGLLDDKVSSLSLTLQVATETRSFLALMGVGETVNISIS